MRSFLFLSALLGCILPSRLNAQYNHFEKITEEQGLSDNRVTCFKKDRTGFLWVGTENGLNRYDGFSFRIYRPGQFPFHLSHERINDIEEDAEGRLWVSTMNGLNVLDPETDSLTVFVPGEEATRQPLTTVSSALIWDTFIDQTGRVWIAPDSRDLSYYDPVKRTFHHLPWRDFVRKMFPQRGQKYSAIQKIARKSKDELWLGTTLGLFSCNTVNNTFQYYGGDDPVDCVSLSYDSIRQIVYFGQRNCYAYDVREKKLDKVREDETIGLVSDRRNAILVPSLSGLWTIDPEQKKTGMLSRVAPAHFSLHHPKASSVYQDNGTVWIGTTAGIRMYDHRLDRFAFLPLFADTVPPGGNAFHILDHTRHQRYYISAVTQHKLVVLDKKTAKQTVISRIEGRPLMQCAKTYEDRRHRLWVLTRFHIFISDSSHEHFR
ncbi:MAG TPA: two-component regulator propeller domain-containing protein, partial [Ohtaekwangia sp.]|nr:two-component regulator propeller domain-containing protein [Ohtaekwangia sp.]